MKTKKELVLLLLEQIKSWNIENVHKKTIIKGCRTPSLCINITNLRISNNLITLEEEIILDKIINKYLLKDNLINRLLFDKRRIRNNQTYEYGYFWSRLNKDVRVAYLEYILERLKS